MQSVNEGFIAASASVIYEFLMNIENRSKYIPQLKEVIPIDPLPFKEGSKYIEVAEIASRQLKTTYQITVLVENRMISAQTVESIFPIQVDLLLSEQNNGTQLTIQLEFQLSGIFKLGASIVKGIVDSQSRGILRRIRSEFES